MNLPGNPTGDNNSPSVKQQLQLQGPRPPPLRVNKDSHKIKKPPLPHPHPHLAVDAAANLPLARQRGEPVIIYAVSPKVVHATVTDFMTVVQRLTGIASSGDASLVETGSLSPAAKLASIENTSPQQKRSAGDAGIDAGLGVGLFEMEGVEFAEQFPGILSPDPTSLLPLSSGFFSPLLEPQNLSFFPEFNSPVWGGNCFAPSPSALLSAPIVSPLPSPDLFNDLLGFLSRNGSQ